MKQKNIIKAINALARAHATNKGFTGSETVENLANEKLILLIPLIKTTNEKSK